MIRWRRVRDIFTCVGVALGIGVLLMAACATSHRASPARPRPHADVVAAARAEPTPWLLEPASRWMRDFSGSPRDDTLATPTGKLEAEGIGSKTRVYDLFDRWLLRPEIRGDRGTAWADITGECKGMIELDFALTPEQWQDPVRRRAYYRAVDTLITTIGETLLADFGDVLKGQERRLFLRALKALAWQESKWQHYLRFKDWFFVVVSGGSYNKLDDWGITQLARSSFDETVLLNKNFFDSKGYCSISSTLYYGFMHFYFCYLEARDNPHNGPSIMNKIVGAYNRYSSGYSSSCFDLAQSDEGYRSYQIRAMGSFKDNFVLEPWKEAIGQ
ncbi:MAG: hypothetical protein ONB25_11395 [candidate division KSB1 bacterium]|nr:hypothetical protein [candidate division KSB1 bacterium]MDZ7413402.1 hypothetical protein [candidate division KSB1 bacterium]